MCSVAATPALKASPSISGGNFQQYWTWNELMRPPSAGALYWSSFTALHWLNNISSACGTDMKDCRLRINEVRRGLVCGCVPQTHRQSFLSWGALPAGVALKHRKTVAAADCGQRDITAYRVSNSSSRMQTLTGGPSLPGRPWTPFFPWGPCWIKVRMWILSFSNKRGKTQERVFYLFSRHSNQSLWTRKTLQETHHDCFLFVSQSIVFSTLEGAPDYKPHCHWHVRRIKHDSQTSQSVKFYSMRSH